MSNVRTGDVVASAPFNRFNAMKAAHDMIYDALLAVVQQRPVIELPDSPKSRSMALSTQDAEVCGVVNIKASLKRKNQ